MFPVTVCLICLPGPGMTPGNWTLRVKAAGMDLKNLRLIPIVPTDGGEKWSTIDEVTIWPDANFALLKPREVVKQTGVHLTSIDLDSSRLDRLREMAGRCLDRMAIHIRAFLRLIRFPIG